MVVLLKYNLIVHALAKLYSRVEKTWTFAPLSLQFETDGAGSFVMQHQVRRHAITMPLCCHARIFATCAVGTQECSLVTCCVLMSARMLSFTHAHPSGGLRGAAGPPQRSGRSPVCPFSVDRCTPLSKSNSAGRKVTCSGTPPQCCAACVRPHGATRGALAFLASCAV
jgi:hypothetical protein